MQIPIDMVYWAVFIIALANAIKELKICARITKRIQRWNCWRKPCLNSKAYKLAVLLGLVKSMTFELTATDEEYEEYRREMEQILTEGRESEK